MGTTGRALPPGALSPALSPPAPLDHSEAVTVGLTRTPPQSTLRSRPNQTGGRPIAPSARQILSAQSVWEEKWQKGKERSPKQK